MPHATQKLTPTANNNYDRQYNNDTLQVHRRSFELHELQPPHHANSTTITTPAWRGGGRNHNNGAMPVDHDNKAMPTMDHEDEAMPVDHDDGTTSVDHYNSKAKTTQTRTRMQHGNGLTMIRTT
ncbi:hypothetical protein EDB89DRAFT_1904031 [Lactarius sanguifluus]|nr:hypothetical protein EDB89DRAFT_1904031 [Lactarius sanguifluus]